jgi:phage I-like protein
MKNQNFFNPIGGVIRTQTAHDALYCADDSKKPYGDVEYADPGYQSDKKKRYPVDTEKHVRAAWSYINQDDNASKYSSDDLAKVKAKIRAACKKFGIDVSEDSSAKAHEEIKTLADLEDSQPVQCRAAIAISPTATNEITFLPAGLHSIRPVAGGIGRAIKVLINTEAAAKIEQQRAEITARTGKRVYFDFNHEDGPASFWPSSFTWRENDGVVAKGEWTASGRRAVEGKDFRAFSPVFHVDDKRKDPARVVCCVEAGPNMGGLVNDPAFNDLPLWAKNDGSPVTALEQPAKKPKTGETNTMTPEEIAALRAKNQELEKEAEGLRAIAAQNADDKVIESRLAATDATIRANAAELELGEIKAQNDQQASVIRKRNKADADAAVRAAVKRGAILPRDIRTQEDLAMKAAADPRFIEVINKMQGSGDRLSERITSSDVSRTSVVNDDPISVYSKLAKVLACSARASLPQEKAQFASEFGAIYAAEFKEGKPNSDRLKGCRMNILNDAIQAADVTDANLGTLAGTLVTQRTLELLKFIFPALTRFTSDFSDQPATFNQTVMTRIITVPTVQTYSTASGWTDAAALTTDVPVVLNNHKGVPITFNENILASTMRRLFDEFAPASAYALAKNIVDAIYALLTDANFTNNTIVASANFARATVVDIGVALTQRGVPLGLGNRTLLLWPTAFGSLVKDPTLVTFAAYQQPRIVTEGTTPQSTFVLTVDTFEVYSAPNMPSNNANLVGFGGSRSALVVTTRPPNDYTSVLPGASFGNVQMVTDPDINITVMQVQYVNHTLGTATSRIAIMYGTAAGQTGAGQLIKASAGSGSSR